MHLTPELFLAFSSIVYLGRVLFFVSGFLKQQALPKRNGHVCSVSVLVPARNEEANIESCIHSIYACNYPKSLLDVVVVNDRSTDGTQGVLEELCRTYPSLRVIQKTQAETHANLQGKPGALQSAANVATGEVLLMTDADCNVPRGWIQGHVDAINIGNTGLVAGFTSMKGKSLNPRFQDVEWLFTQAMAAGGVGHNIPLGCFGNNLSVRADVFRELGGYTGIPFSITEDMALQAAIFERGYAVRHVCSNDLAVETNPCATVSEYVNQHHRWARGGVGLGRKAIGFVFTSLLLWVSLVFAAVFGHYQWLIALVGIKIIGDGFLTAMVAVTMKRSSLLPFIIPSLILLMLTELSLPLLILKPSVRWKNQLFKG